MSDGTARAMEEIDEAECLRLVGPSGVGRLAVGSAQEPPLVVPVNFVLDGRTVVFRSDAGSKLEAVRGRHDDDPRIAKAPNASFQVDQIDPVHRTGWSVLIRGLAYEAIEDEVAHLNLTAWAPGEKRTWVRLVPTSITGRRINAAGDSWDTRGYL